MAEMKLTNPINISDIQSRISVITMQQELFLAICHSMKYLISQAIILTEFSTQNIEKKTRKTILLR